MSNRAAHQRRTPEPSRTLPAVLLLIAFAWPFVAAIIMGVYGLIFDGAPLGLLTFIYGGMLFLWAFGSAGILVYYLFLAVGMIVAIVLITKNKEPEQRTARTIGIVLVVVVAIQLLYTTLVMILLNTAF